MMIWFWVYALFAAVHASTHPSMYSSQCIAESSKQQRSCALLQVGKQSTTADTSECKLQFLHIPKNAGTAVENWGKNAGLQWGRHLLGTALMDGLCSFHHVPPSMFTSAPNPYLDSDKVFCVKRDPYSRAVSQYSYTQSLLIEGGESKDASSGCDGYEICSASGMNCYLKSVLSSINDKSMSPFSSNCHFLPQAEYIWSGAGGDDQTCKHVLALENLTDEFEELMASEDCELPESYAILDNVTRFEGDNSGDCEHLSTSDLEPETKTLIQEVYKDDFEKLGFSM